jgi:hypothetical protein
MIAMMSGFCDAASAPAGLNVRVAPTQKAEIPSARNASLINLLSLQNI